MASPALARAENKVDSLRSRLSGMREKHEETVRDVVGTVVSGGAGLALGMAEEYWGEDAVLGVSVPLVVGVPSLIAGLAGVGGDMASGVLLRTGQAAIAIEAYKGGLRLARDWMAESDE